MKLNIRKWTQSSKCCSFNSLLGFKANNHILEPQHTCGKYMLLWPVSLNLTFRYSCKNKTPQKFSLWIQKSKEIVFLAFFFSRNEITLEIRINLNRFPNGITVGANNHGATHRTIVSELSVGNDIQVPSVEVLRPRRDDSVSVRVDSALRVAIDSLFLARRLRSRSSLSRRESSS